ncbi:Putative teichuronic acid biosynthesis glycosyltransferase TuaC [Stieleria bergensis]|uniref:Teichuronic acid biosynthesis glycosyltransferase TuaC n=1 Tax=Stieleria bergensis TaxID=2528025 RepID=A0A517T304_9BACT|nr:Putative teichuronic acid biosynthesis glycosyltransferase TuaC [Planctomycetes bacterium SV_7m_r]
MPTSDSTADIASTSSPPTRVLLMAGSMEGGGSERQVLLLAKHLDRSRFEPHLYLSNRSGKFLDQVPDDVPIHAFDQQPQKRIFFERIPGQALRRQASFLASVVAAQQIQVLYDRTFHMSMLAGTLPKVNSALAAKLHRVATIVSLPHLAVPMLEPRYLWLKRRRLAQAYRLAQSVVAVSQQAAASAAGFYKLPPDLVQVIRNPVDRAQIQRDAEVGFEFDRPNHTHLVCVGRMSEEKGHMDLLAAIPDVIKQWPETLPEPMFHFIGDGELYGTIQRHLDQQQLSGAVQMPGSVASAAPIIAAADAVILPSRFEGMPNVALESFALGTPLIATRAGGTLELQGDQPTAFWANPKNPTSLSRAILEFANQPHQADQHVMAAMAILAKNHDLTKTVKQIESLLQPKQRQEAP